MNALVPASTLRVVDLLEETDTLRETVRRYEEVLRPSIALPRHWRLTGRETDLLLAIYAAEGRVAHRERLLVALYGYIDAETPEPKILDVFMVHLRRKLMEAQTRISIETVWGRGWRLDAESHVRLRAAIEAETLGSAA